MDFDWTCPQCGEYIERDTLDKPKKCPFCGYNDEFFDLDDIPDDNRGYY